MANQYTGNFEQIMKNKFKCSAKDMLLRCKKEGLSYQEAEKVLGFKHVTIRKWAKRFDIKLPPKFIASSESSSENCAKSYISKCRDIKINKSNIFSRSWVNMRLYSAIKARH